MAIFRKLEIYRDGKWVDAHMNEIKVGELFRMFDPPEMTPVRDSDGSTVFKAMTEPKPYGSDGNWILDTEGVDFNEEV
jgi:hypothetical protein